MHRRILFGVVAWLLGAATATAACLLAVSLLGQGITGASGPLLSQDAVNRALASEAAEPATTAPDGPAAPSGDQPSGGQPSDGQPSDGQPSSGDPSGLATQTPTQASTSSPAPSGLDNPSQPVGTVLTSRGGDVVASCLPGGAYLDSWSPSQGYEVDSVFRGPSAAARVTFESGSDVTMVVSCTAGVPSATTYSGEAGDD
jgi:hypothetical protein